MKAKPKPGDEHHDTEHTDGGHDDAPAVESTDATTGALTADTDREFLIEHGVPRQLVEGRDPDAVLID